MFRSFITVVRVVGFRVMLVNESVSFVRLDWSLAILVSGFVTISIFVRMEALLVIPCCCLSLLKLNDNDCKSLKFNMLVFLLFLLPSELFLFVFLYFILSF